MFPRAAAAAARVRPASAALAVLLALATLASGCSSAPAHPHAVSPAHPPATRPTAAVETRAGQGAILHWGSFFGASKGGNFDFEASPASLTLPGPVAEVGSSNSTEYALLENGSLYAWGLGYDGELGDGQHRNSFRQPVQVRFPAGVRIAWIPTDAMPFDTGLAVDTSGRVWGWGLNHGGELCLGNKRKYPTPVELPLSGISALAGASNHVLYDSHGTVYACGQNVDGDLGTGRLRNNTRPRRVARLAGARVTSLVASFANSGALLSDGTYLDWGYDGFGELGDGTTGRQSDVPVRVRLPGPVSQVALGGSIWANGQTLVMLADGSTWAWGCNRAGQLDDGRARAAQPSPARFSAPAGVRYVLLATGSATSYAISDTGAVYAWGAGQLAQVGDGSTQVQRTPTWVSSHATGISSTANNVVISIRTRD